jgi:hypothetical protein
VPARADHHGRLEDAPIGLDAHPGRPRAHLLHPDTPAHVGPRGGRSLEQVVVELAPDDAVARGPTPVRLVPRRLELEHACTEGLDGQRILVGLDLEVGQRGPRHPSRADLHAREHGGIEDERVEAGAGQAPRSGASPRSPAHHDRVMLGH